MNATTIRGYVETDHAAVNKVALAAFAQYAGDYDDWPTFSAGIGRMADLAADGDLLAEHLLAGDYVVISQAKSGAVAGMHG
ncbi:hypothetical protein ACEN88_32895, partial [Massilia sp. CT11-108]